MSEPSTGPHTFVCWRCGGYPDFYEGCKNCGNEGTVTLVPARFCKSEGCRGLVHADEDWCFTHRPFLSEEEPDEDDGWGD